MRVGSLFSGYGGLDIAVGGDVVWYSEIEPAACKVLAAHHPGVPNLGDIKKIDWTTVAPIDVLTGGYPCQPFSAAGLRKGKEDERHLWPYVKDAISALRPRFAVLENVRGHLSLGLADVIGELASVGYDARWGLIRASDARAPHGRARVFIVAYPESDERDGRPPRYDFRDVRKERKDKGASRRVNSNAADSDLPVSKTSNDGRPWPRDPRRREPLERTGTNWGQYSAAVRRWEPVLGRSAPAPTIRRRDRERLNPLFVEWMMGLPEGHVTGHGLSVSQELKMLGNGVVPQQARLALELLGFPS
jgi:DNA (cytosine-5)-methyltransferase 1